MAMYAKGDVIRITCLVEVSTLDLRSHFIDYGDIATFLGESLYLTSHGIGKIYDDEFFCLYESEILDEK